MKRINAVFLILLFLLTLCCTACQKKDNSVPTTSTNNPTEEATETSEDITPTTSEVTTEAEPTDTTATTVTQNQYLNTTSLELVELMGNGINLGNTMEAYGHGTLGTNAPISQYETYWGQPVTTQDMITSMKEAGFDTLRVPVAWTNAMNYESGDYTIRTEYLDRVEEIIQYALNADMFVIVNDHWDGSWWGKFGSATQSIRDEAMEMYISMWTQIAERYKDYDDRLIFESANEELGSRLNDTDVCADSGSLSEDECYETTNQINQTFVDTIRSTGGNNEQRFLLIAGYNTDITMTCDDRYQMPSDSALNKLLLSVHYYTPWVFCGTTSVNQWGTQAEYEEQNQLFQMLEKYTSQGYGVVIGEYAVCLADDSSVKESTYDFIKNLLNNCDVYGYCPLLWDCSSLFKRTQLSFIDDDIAELFKEYNNANRTSMTEDEIIANAKTSLDEALAAAPESREGVNISTLADDEAMAWIMFNSSDYSITYSVGDTYNPSSKTDGVIAGDVSITGAGTYTVSLDFTGTNIGYAEGTSFSALAIANGESLYPGYVIDIKEVLVNGESYSLNGRPYTTSDDSICTRVNLYNEWVSDVPETARTIDGYTTCCSASLFDNETLGQIETLSITFDYSAVD